MILTGNDPVYIRRKIFIFPDWDMLSKGFHIVDSIEMMFPAETGIFIFFDEGFEFLLLLFFQIL
jgi:hypothetical protein